MAKKSLKLILLASSACLLTSLIFPCLNKRNREETQATSINSIETAAFVHIVNWGEVGVFAINFAEATFSEEQTVNYASCQSKFETLDFVSHIYINGESMNFDSFNAEGFKFTSFDTIGFNQVAPKNGQFSLCIRYDAGRSYSDISTIEIDKGCLFPSPSYLAGSSSDVYSLAGKLSVSPAGVNWDWINYMESEVYKISTVDNTYLGLTLTASDFPNASGGPLADGQVGDSFTNYATHISLDNGVTMATGTYGLFCYGTVRSIWPQTIGNPNTCSSVTISDGLIVRSYHGTKSEPIWPLYFKCIGTQTFTKVNNEWSQLPVYEDTTIEDVNLTSINGEWLSFRLSNSDYSTFSQVNSVRSSFCNLWDEIILVDSSGISHKASEITANYAHIFNYLNAHEGEIAINLVTGYKDKGSIKKVIIPAGTEFPEFAYINGTNTNRPRYFRTTEEKIFAYDTTDTPYLEAEIRQTTISGMGFNVNGYLHFILSNNDYPALGSNTGGTETIFNDFRSKIDLSGIGLAFANNTYVLWSYNPYDDSIAPNVNGNLSNGYVTIPQGTLFPSYVYSNNSSAPPVVYKTSEDATFLYNGVEFIDVSHPWTIDNSITGLETHGNYGTADFVIDIMVSTFDWPNNVTDFDLINNATHGDNQYATKFNTFNKFIAYDNNFNVIPFTSEMFVNVWGKVGCYSLRLSSPVTNMERLAYVIIEEGLELPTYAGFYTDTGSNKYGDNSRYIIEEKMIFAYSTSARSFVEIDFIENETEVTAVNEIDPTSQNSYISFSLSSHDYSGLASDTDVFNINSTEFNQLNFSDYITINGVKLSDLDNYGTDGIYISSNGTIKLRTPGNNTGYYYLNGLNRVYTADLSKYEIRIAKGCQFPSYASLTGSNSLATCYATKEDISFALFNGQYVAEDQGYAEPIVNDNSVKEAGYLSVNSSDKCIYFRLTNTDWPNSSVVGDADIHSVINCTDFLNKIEVFDVDGHLHTPTTPEVFINVWGTGVNEASIGFRTDISSAGEIKKIVIHEGCLIPTYSNYTTHSDSWYLLSERSFYSSLDGTFYSGTDLSAKEYACEFNEAFDDVCSGYDGISSNKVALENKFYAFKNIYQEELSASVRAAISRSSVDADVLSMIETYDYVIRKYALEDFLSLGAAPNNSSFFSSVGLGSTDTYIVVVLFSLVLVSVGGCILVSKKKKGE